MVARAVQDTQGHVPDARAPQDPMWELKVHVDSTMITRQSMNDLTALHP
jgi:hypothetical protein